MDGSTRRTAPGVSKHLDKDGRVADVVPVPGLEGAQQLQARALGINLAGRQGGDRAVIR